MHISQIRSVRDDTSARRAVYHGAECREREDLCISLVLVHHSRGDNRSRIDLAIINYAATCQVITIHCLF